MVRFLGTSDDVTTCECCGRANLKSTVALLTEGATTPVYYGVTCAARSLKMQNIEVAKAARQVERDHAAALAHEDYLAWRVEDARWQAFLDARAPGLRERADQIVAVGGYSVARADYLAGNRKAA